MREYINLDIEEIKKLKEEDRRFIMNISHTEYLFNENMLLQNRVLVIAIFALFASILALIIPLSFISATLKILLVLILSISSLWLIIMFSTAIKSVKDDNLKIKNAYDASFKYHLNYTLKKERT
jgi:ABC-type transport system involved in cytochrome bd biosynthesis fused ATPase/permease subunit